VAERKKKKQEGMAVKSCRRARIDKKPVSSQKSCVYVNIYSEETKRESRDGEVKKKKRDE
jgi:hypothetical protein